MHIAALIGGLRQNLAQSGPQTSVIICHYKLGAVETAALEPE